MYTVKHFPGKHDQSSHGKDRGARGAYHGTYRNARAGGATIVEARQEARAASEKITQEQREKHRAEVAKRRDERTVARIKGRIDRAVQEMTTDYGFGPTDDLSKPMTRGTAAALASMRMTPTELAYALNNKKTLLPQLDRPDLLEMRMAGGTLQTKKLLADGSLTLDTNETVASAQKKLKLMVGSSLPTGISSDPRATPEIGAKTNNRNVIRQEDVNAISAMKPQNKQEAFELAARQFIHRTDNGYGTGFGFNGYEGPVSDMSKKEIADAANIYASAIANHLYPARGQKKTTESIDPEGTKTFSTNWRERLDPRTMYGDPLPQPAPIGASLKPASMIERNGRVGYNVLETGADFDRALKQKIPDATYDQRVQAWMVPSDRRGDLEHLAEQYYPKRIAYYRNPTDPRKPNSRAILYNTDSPAEFHRIGYNSGDLKFDKNFNNAVKRMGGSWDATNRRWYVHPSDFDDYRDLVETYFPKQYQRVEPD